MRFYSSAHYFSLIKEKKKKVDIAIFEQLKNIHDRVKISVKIHKIFL